MTTSKRCERCGWKVPRFSCPHDCNGVGLRPVAPPYTKEQLDDFALRDLIVDAEQSEQQAAHGPFYPERGITAESLRAHAARCRAAAEKHKDGGAHRAVHSGEAFE